MVGQHGPSVTGGAGVRQEPPQLLDEIVAAGIAPKNPAALDASANDMVLAPGALMCALRGMIYSKHGVISNATHENRGVPYSPVW
jgi:hypothetical protein